MIKNKSIRSKTFIFWMFIMLNTQFASTQKIIHLKNDTIIHFAKELSTLKSGPKSLNSFAIQSPDKLINLFIFNTDSGIYYKINYKNKTILDLSRLGLTISNNDEEVKSIAINNSSKRDKNYDKLMRYYKELETANKKYDFCKNFEIDSLHSFHIREVVRLYFKEKDSISSNYNSLILYLKDSANRKLNIEFKVFNNTIAFRYTIPNSPYHSTYIKEEYSEFSFPKNYDIYPEESTASGYIKTSINNFSSNSLTEIPLLVTNGSIFFLIGEANNAMFSRVMLKRSRKNTMAIKLSYSTLATLPIQTPWRFIHFAENLPSFYDSKYTIYALNNSDSSGRYKYKPGKVFRDMTLTTESIKTSIDFASEMNFQYVLFDAGWYGLGYEHYADPKSNPMKVYSLIDMPFILKYAFKKNIEIMLYIDYTALSNFNLDSMFILYKKWGIRALKFGFVDDNSQKGRTLIFKAIKKARDNDMMVDIHDNLRPSGLEQTYLNYMTTEGVRGNEFVTNTAKHTTILLFSRFMIGAADYCNSFYASKNSRLAGMTVTKGHQIAISIAFFSPFQHLFWYGEASDYPNRDEIEFYKYLPTTWDDTKLIDGSIGNYAIIARKKNDKWFWSTYSSIAKSIIQDCKFLENNYYYRRTCFVDSANTIAKQSAKVTRNTLENFEISANGGCACIFEKIQSTTALPIRK
jgi:alpha-glucosidase